MEELKMRFQDGYSGKGIEKAYGYLQQTRQKVAAGELRLQCQCLHQKNGSATLKRSNQKTKDAEGNEVPLWICRRCGKLINLKRLDFGKLDAACDTVDQAIDTIKMLANPSHEPELEALRKMVKAQMRLPMIRKSYTAAVKDGKRNTNRGRENAQPNDTFDTNY